MFLVAIPALVLIVLIDNISIQKKANGEKQASGNPTLETCPWQSRSKPPPGLHVLRNTHRGLNLASHQYSI